MLHTNKLIKKTYIYICFNVYTQITIYIKHILQIRIFAYLIIYKKPFTPRGACRCPRGGIRGGVLVMPLAYTHPTPRQGRRKAPQCGGPLASELMVSGLFSKGDCSIYQLFRFSVWVTSYKGVVYVIRLLSIIYRGETIIHIQKNRKYIFNSIQNNQKPTIFARKQINI